MKKISDIVLVIGGILGILAILGFLAGTILSAVIANGGIKDVIVSGIEDGSINVGTDGTTEEKYQYVVAVFKIMMVLFIVLMVFDLMCVIICFVSAKKSKSGLYIADIALGVLLGNLIILIGGILGLIAVNKDPQLSNQ